MRDSETMHNKREQATRATDARAPHDRFLSDEACQDLVKRAIALACLVR